MIFTFSLRPSGVRSAWVRQNGDGQLSSFIRRGNDLESSPVNPKISIIAKKLSIAVVIIILSVC